MTPTSGSPRLNDLLAAFTESMGAFLTAVGRAEERAAQVPHGQKLWTARRALRRCLEHEWEHLMELSRRLGLPPAADAA